MKLISAVVLALVLPVLGAPPEKHTIHNGARQIEVKADSYLVKLKSASNKEAHFDGLRAIRSDGSSIFELKYEYSTVLPLVYSAKLTGAALEAVLADPNVDYVSADGKVQLDRVFRREESSHQKRSPTPEEHAARVRQLQARQHDHGMYTTVYSIDTGVMLNHTEFNPDGRARWGATFGEGYPDEDDNGHGTHTSGIAAGVWWGVAGQASVVAVKVLDYWGSGWWSDVIAGIDWAVADAISDDKKAVINLSLGGGVTKLVDDAIKAGVAAGVHFTISAGNSFTDACATSPARVRVANTIGAIDADKNVAWFSNYGSVVDVWAPGVDIKSAYPPGITDTAFLSGTSMSAPYVAGLVLLAMSRYGNTDPATMSQWIKDHAVADVLFVPEEETTNLRAVAW